MLSDGTELWNAYDPICKSMVTCEPQVLLLHCQAPRRTLAASPDSGGATADPRFILGSESMTVMREDTMTAMSAIRGARLRILEGEKHIAHYTAPHRLAETIQDLATSE